MSNLRHIVLSISLLTLLTACLDGGIFGSGSGSSGDSAAESPSSGNGGVDDTQGEGSETPDRVETGGMTDPSYYLADAIVNDDFTLSINGQKTTFQVNSALKTDDSGEAIALLPGMVVTAIGETTSEGIPINASSVSYSPVFVGTTVISNADSQTFEAGKSRVSWSNNTVISRSLDSGQIYSVNVSGYKNAAGDIIATRIDAELLSLEESPGMETGEPAPAEPPVVDSPVPSEQRESTKLIVISAIDTQANTLFADGIVYQVTPDTFSAGKRFDSLSVGTKVTIVLDAEGVVVDYASVRQDDLSAVADQRLVFSGFVELIPDAQTIFIMGRKVTVSDSSIYELGQEVSIEVITVDGEFVHSP